MTLHTGKFHSGKSGQTGQAMTEMVIAASFLLVPLFLLIPWLGKYIDLHQSAIQAARYEAWEYTVWYNDVATEAPAGAVDNSGAQIAMPEKSIAVLQAEARQRFFSGDAYSTNSSRSRLNDNDNTRWDITDANPLWQDHLGNPLLFPTSTTIDDTALESFDHTPGNAPLTATTTAVKDTLEIDKLIYKEAKRSANTEIKNLIKGSTSPTFEIDNLKGYSHTRMIISIISQPGLVDFGTLSGTYAVLTGAGPTTSLKSYTRAAVLSDGWNAGGRYHVRDQVGEMTIARKLKSLSDTFIKLKGYGDIIGSDHFGLGQIPPSNPKRTADLIECEEQRGGGWGPLNTTPGRDYDGSLWTGYVDNEAIHPDRLHELTTAYTVDANPIPIGGHDCGLFKTCNFTYNDPTYKYPWADPLVDEKLEAPDDCIK